MPLAIFDLDDTLIAGDSDHAWGQFLVSKHLVDEKTFKVQNDRFFQQYQQGVLDVDAYLAFSCAPLAQISPVALDQLQAEFMRAVIAPMILHLGLARIAEHRKQGDFVMIITATLDVITEPIAHALGVETVLAPVAEIKEGRYTGAVKGIATLGQGKVDRLNLWLSRFGLGLSFGHKRLLLHRLAHQRDHAFEPCRNCNCHRTHKPQQHPCNASVKFLLTQAAHIDCFPTHRVE